MTNRVRVGTVVCRIWEHLAMEGDFHILLHYRRDGDGVDITAAYSRYNSEITDITDKIRTIRLIPNWKDRIPQ